VDRQARVKGLGPATAHARLAIGLFVLAALFLGPRLFVDRTILVGDGFFYVDPSFRAGVPPDVYTTKPRNFLSHIDNGLHGYPHLHYTQTTLSSGEIPWWNPYLGLGLPGIGVSAAAFEPITLVLGRLFSVPMVSNLKSMVAMAIGGWGMAVFVRGLGASRTASVLAAVAFAFSGWTVAWLGRTNMVAEMWLPWMFWAADAVLAGRGARFVGALSVFTGFACLSSHPQTAVQMLAALAVYAGWRALRGGPLRAASRALVLVTAGVLLGIAIGLVQLVPTGQLIADADLPAQGRSRTEQASSIGEAIVYGVRGDFTVARRDLPTALMALSPHFFGNAAHSTYWWRGYNMMEMMVYAGLVPLFFAAYAAARRRETPHAVFWLVVAVGSLGVVYALPVFNLVNYVPVLGLANNGRLRLLFRFALIVAAALGFDRFVADQREGRARWVAWIGGFALVVLAAPTAARVIMEAIGGYRLPSLPSALLAHAGVVAVLALLALVMGLRAAGVLRPGVFRAAIVVVAFADMWWHFGDFNPPIPTTHVYPDIPVVRALRSDPALYRVASALPARLMTPNSKLPYRLFDVDLFDVLNLKRYAQLQAAVNGRASRPDNTTRVFEFDPGRHRPLMSLMNVRYVLAPNPAYLPGSTDVYEGRPDFRRVYDREVRVYANPDALPRAFLVGRAEVVTSDAALARVTAADFDPRASVLLEDPASPPATATVVGSTAVAALTANRVVVRTEAPAPAYLVLSDAYHRGWHASVDGAAAPIYQADFMFRAVHVPAGTHEVVFEFAPRSYQIAIAGTLAALVVAIVCVSWPSLRRGRASAS
jgi:membrane protein YfhO